LTYSSNIFEEIAGLRPVDRYAVNHRLFGVAHLGGSVVSGVWRVVGLLKKGSEMVQSLAARSPGDQLRVVTAENDSASTTTNEIYINSALPSVAWDEDDPAHKNYRLLGEVLAKAGDLFRRSGHGGGLLHAYEDGSHENIRSAADLAPVMVDRVALNIYLDGKPKGSKLSAAHMNAMLRAESFLDQFQTVDQVTSVARYLPDYSITNPGFNDGGTGHRVLFAGTQPHILQSLDHVEAFLDVMAFDGEADRTNAVAAALTIQMRHHWPGGKPIVLTTANKSHAGKDTVILFASGQTKQSSISYQATNWALERSFVGALNQIPDVGVVVIENARLDRKDRCLASAFIERFSTDPEPFLFSTGTGPGVRRRNDVVLAISTNYGSVSEDILNRSLPIHLNPVGSVADRRSPIGNPKLEFLPQYRAQIAGELHGMIARWKQAGSPLETEIRHPFSEWAKIIGGILKVSGFQDFLGNYGSRRVSDDPLRKGIGLLGAALHTEGWLRTTDWARTAVKLGVVKSVIPPGDQDSTEGRKRGIGVVFSAHRDELFIVETETEALALRLERRRGRFGESEPHVRYRFVVVQKEQLTEDAPPHRSGALEAKDAGSKE
jgi:hypothetical protein